MTKRLRHIVQKLGMASSRRLFTVERLERVWAKEMYLCLYGGFKKLFEGKEWHELDRYIRPGSTVIDIGANVGFTSLHFSHVVGRQGSVLAFEPDPTVCGLFEHNIGKAKVDNIHLYRLALSNRSGEADFFQNNENRADNRLFSDETMVPHRNRISVLLATLDDLACNSPVLFKDVSFIKIDVQGNEFRVLDGMTKWLRSLDRKPVMRLEIWPYGMVKSGSDPNAIFAKLDSLGYSSVPESAEIEAMGRGPHDYTDIICVPKSYG